MKPLGTKFAVRPRAQLIADAITERICNALHLVFVLAFYHREKDLARRPQQRVRPRAPDDLEKRQHGKARRDRHRRETEHAEKRKRRQGKRDTEPLEKTAGEKDLDEKGNAVDPDFEI